MLLLQEAYDVQQELILRDSAKVYRRGLSRPDISVEELKQQGAEYFIESVFPVRQSCPELSGNSITV